MWAYATVRERPATGAEVCPEISEASNLLFVKATFSDGRDDDYAVFDPDSMAVIQG